MMYMYIYKDHVDGRDCAVRGKMGTKNMEEVEAVIKRFGDEQSTLMDRFERISFEAQLTQAILGRSFSEPCVPWLQPPSESTTVAQGQRNNYHHRGLGFQKALKKFFKPIFGKKKGETKESIPDQKNFKFMKSFSRSLRV